MRQKTGLVATLVCAMVLGIANGGNVLAANNSTFNQTINAGTLSTNILDASRNPVVSPSVGMTAKNFAFECYSGGNASTGTFGTNAERIYVINPNGADNGWTLALAATSGANAQWTAGANTFDFNDAGTGGCTDGADTDTKGGQLTVNPSVGAVTTDCTACSATGVTKGSSTAYAEGTTNSATLLNAASASDDIWRGYLTGAGLSQTVPAETQSGAYTLNMTLTATAL